MNFKQFLTNCCNILNHEKTIYLFYKKRCPSGHIYRYGVMYCDGNKRQGIINSDAIEYVLQWE